MKIYIDGQPLIGNKTGIGYYTQNLVESYLKTNLDVIIITNQILNKKRMETLAENEVSHVNNKLFPYKVLRKLMLPTFFYKYPIDTNLKKEERENAVYHATNFITLPTKYAKQVITIHDLAFMKFPKVVDESIYKYMMKWVPYSISRADQIIADSIHTKRDILAFFDIPEDKVNVVYLAADNRFQKRSIEDIHFVKSKYKLPEKYILYVGTLEPKKNLVTLIEVYYQLKKRYAIEEKLVIVGAKGWKFDSIFEKIQQLELQDDICFTGYIDDEDVPSIYSGASIFAFPSTYEGFGIPLLEAMQCEVPVVASNASCIPEVVGEAGLLFDPYDIDGWVEGMYNILTKEALRTELIHKGLQQASQFSWEKTAKETLAVYEKALKGD